MGTHGRYAIDPGLACAFRAVCLVQKTQQAFVEVVTALQISKCFPGSAIFGPWIPVEQLPDYLEREFTFSLDGQLKQKGKGSEMRLAPEDAISYIEEYFPLTDGDIVMTGTPAGVGEIQPGQVGELHWADKLKYEIQF